MSETTLVHKASYIPVLALRALLETAYTVLDTPPLYFYPDGAIRTSILSRDKTMLLRAELSAYSIDSEFSFVLPSSFKKFLFLFKEKGGEEDVDIEFDGEKATIRMDGVTLTTETFKADESEFDKIGKLREKSDFVLHVEGSADEFKKFFSSLPIEKRSYLPIDAEVSFSDKVLRIPEKNVEKSFWDGGLFAYGKGEGGVAFPIAPLTEIIKSIWRVNRRAFLTLHLQKDKPLCLTVESGLGLELWEFWLSHVVRQN